MEILAASLLFPLLLLLLLPLVSHAWDRDTLLLLGGFVEDAYNRPSALMEAGDYTITRNLYATETTGSFYGKPLVGIGYVAISHSRRDVVVVLRGTSNVPEWVKNLMVEQVQFTFLNGSTSNAPDVHDGFLSLYTSASSDSDSLRNQIVDEVRKLVTSNSGYHITTVGHSLGGALATLSAFDISNSDVVSGSGGVSVYTFASPMVGDGSFKQQVEQLSSLSVLRVSDIRDVVPYLPSLNYKHVGEELSVDGCHQDSPGGDFASKVIEYHSIARYLRTVASLNTQQQSGSSLQGIDDDIVNFVKMILSSASKSFSGFKNLFVAMKNYASNYNKSCS